MYFNSIKLKVIMEILIIRIKIKFVDTFKKSQCLVKKFKNSFPKKKKCQSVFDTVLDTTKFFYNNVNEETHHSLKNLKNNFFIYNSTNIVCIPVRMNGIVFR